MSSKNDLIKVARSQLGVKESPAGSNKVKYSKWYGLVGPWCAMFVSWCADQAGIPVSVIPKHAYTPSGRNWFKARGQWGSTPQVGAIAYYNLAGLGRISHVGIVEKVLSDGSFYAIEGNTDEAGGRTGGKVMRKHRKYLGAGGGFGYPAYDGKSTNPKVSTPSTSAYEDGDAKHSFGSRIMRKYDGGTDVRRLQELLKSAGYDPGLIDGQFGPGTEEALRAFQEAKGLVVDAEAGPKTLAKLAPTDPPAKHKKVKFPLKRGHWFGVESNDKRNHSGAWLFDRPKVRKLQKRLGVKIDGRYGPKTAAAVRAFQKKNRLTVDGEVGSITWSRLF